MYQTFSDYLNSLSSVEQDWINSLCSWINTSPQYANTIPKFCEMFLLRCNQSQEKLLEGILQGCYKDLLFLDLDWEATINASVTPCFLVNALIKDFPSYAKKIGVDVEQVRDERSAIFLFSKCYCIAHFKVPIENVLKQEKSKAEFN